MQIIRHSVVSFDYVLTDSEGQVMDSSRQAGPMLYLHGVGGMIPGLEAAMDGRAKGDSFQVTIPPEKAYGVKDQSKVMALPRDRFRGIPRIEVGMQFQAQTGQGPGRVVRVVAVDDKDVTVDGNHPLAGQSLTFDVNVVDVREATLEEIEHGHIHMPQEGGCCGGGGGGGCGCGGGEHAHSHAHGEGEGCGCGNGGCGCGGEHAEAEGQGCGCGSEHAQAEAHSCGCGCSSEEAQSEVQSHGCGCQSEHADSAEAVVKRDSTATV